MNFTGERVVPHKMGDRTDIIVEHIARYNFALNYIAGKRVFDAACGSGYGMEIMSWVAKSVVGIDKDPITVTYAMDNFGIWAQWGDLDLINIWEDKIEDKFDVVTSFETIEHLENPDIFLSWVAKNKLTLIFSIPLNQPSEFHKRVYTSVADVNNLLMPHFDTIELFSQKGMNFYPVGNDADYIVGIAKNI